MCYVLVHGGQARVNRGSICFGVREVVAGLLVCPHTPVRTLMVVVGIADVLGELEMEQRLP